jgi:hypothetical protein
MNRLPVRFAAVLLLALVPSAAVAREAANPRGRLVLDPAAAAPAAKAAPAARLESAPGPAAALDQASGAVVLDSTWYDLQDMGSLGRRLVVAADGRVHVTWQDDFCELAGQCPPNLSAPQPFPQRGMAYAARDLAGAWTTATKVTDPRIRNCCLTDLAGGFGALDVDGAGRVVIAQHLNEEGCDLRGNFYLKDGSGPTGYSAYLSPIRSPSFLFPQTVATAGGGYVTLGEVPRGGLYDETDETATSFVAAPGASFTCPVGWQGGPWTMFAPPALFPDGRGAFPAIAAAADGRVGIALTDFGGNVRLFESSNGSFAPGTVTIRTLTAYTDAQITAPDSTSAQYRPYIHVHVAYADTVPHVVWSELQARRVGGNVTYADWRSRIVHWSSLGGITVVHQVAPGTADRYDEVDRGLAGPLAGFNTLSVDWPQVGFSPDGGETYVAWLRFADAEVDPTANAGLPGIVTGIGFGDIAAAVRTGGGGWSTAQNLTQTPQVDERFFSLATRNPDGRAHVLYQASASAQAGVALIGDRGTNPGNILRKIAYLERPLAASLVDVGAPVAAAPALRAVPNPARGLVRFVDATGAPTGGLELFTVDGRRVARLAAAGNQPATWDGRDASGRPVPSGVYFARRTEAPGSPGSAGLRFLWLAR